MKTIKDAWNALKGYKTYLICFAWIVYTIAGAYIGQINLPANPTAIYLPLAVMALRHGLSTELFKALIQILASQQVVTEPAQVVSTEVVPPIEPVVPIAEPTVTVPLETTMEALRQVLTGQQ